MLAYISFHSRLMPLALTLSLALITPFLSAADDWVLTERFNSQLAAAKKGDALAMYEVGRMYERGRGVDQDITKSAQWYKAASDKGQREARARLGILYLEGLGVEQNTKKAAELLISAAQAGVSAAQYYLATMYENGDGVPRDSQQALKWYKAAADGGYYQAKARVNELSNRPIPKVVEKTAPVVKGKPGERLLRSILNGKWVKENEAASFLPSLSTRCDQSGSLTLTCVSGELLRKTPAMTVRYVLEAKLSGFNASDQFVVEYVNNVLGATEQSKENADGSKPLSFAIKTGKQSTVHKLNCELEEENRLVCVKDRITTLVFTR